MGWPGISFTKQGWRLILEKGHINTYGESDFDYEILRSFMNRGHNIRMATGIFGGYQAIMKKDGVYYGASAFRKDGKPQDINIDSLQKGSSLTYCKAQMS